MRLTNKWTKTAEEAFGPTGAKGLVGELFLMEVFKKWGWEATHNESDRKEQNEGKDITFRNPKWYSSYTCDVKNNMDRYGNFYVEKKWLDKVKCDRIFHVNPDTGWMVWYGVDEMRKVYDNTQPMMKITAKSRYPFMTARREQL